jgi:hypothetical protein
MHSENKRRLTRKKIKIKEEEEEIEKEKRPNILRVVGEMEIIPGLNSKQSVSCSCMNHQFYTRCFKKSFTSLKAYINLFRGHVQCSRLS